MIQIQNGNGGNGGSTPTPQPAELNIYSKDGSIDVIDEYDENDEPTGWKNIQRVNDLSAEELEAGAMVLMNFAEEDIVKKQQTYIISTNNGRRIEVTFSGAYTIESLQDLNISVRGDVGDDDMCMIRMYMDPGDDQGNRYQGYFFMIWFTGPYQYTQDDDEAFYMSADSDRSLINWMWNGLSNEAIQRLELFDDDVYHLSDYSEGGGDEPEPEQEYKLYVTYDTPYLDYPFKYPIIYQNDNIQFPNIDTNGSFFKIFTKNIGNYDYCLDDNFSLNGTVKDTGLMTIVSQPEFINFRLGEKNARNFCAFLKSYNAEKNKFFFEFKVNENNEISFDNTFRETATENGFIPRIVNNGYYNIVSCPEMFYYCTKLERAYLDIVDIYASFKSLFRTFKGCANLEEVTIRGGGKNIGSLYRLTETFSGCTSLIRIVFKNIAYDSTGEQMNMTDCFLNCNSLTNIDLDNCNNDFITAIQTNAPAGVTVTIN